MILNSSFDQADHHHRRRERHRQIHAARRHRRARRLRRSRRRQGLYAGRPLRRARKNGRTAFDRRCARAGCRRSPTAGSFAPRASSRSRDIWTRPASPATAGLPLAFPWRRFSALLRRALPAAGHLHLRRTGIRAVARAPDRVFEADAADGEIGHCQIIMATHSPMLMAYPNATPVAADEIRAGAGDGEGHRSLQGHAGVLRGSGGVCGGGDGGVRL